MPSIYPQQVHVSNHSLIQHLLAQLREETTSTEQFAQLLDKITTLLVYEVTKEIYTRKETVRTPLSPALCNVLDDKLVLVPILRAGLGMVNAFLNLLPGTTVFHVGIYRDEETLQPQFYLNKMPPHLFNNLYIVLDPMLATGGTLSATCDELKKRGATRIVCVCVIAAPEGIKVMVENHPDVEIHIAVVDDHLNNKGYIVPGLGDAGDRQFGTV